jgi:transcriptional regulator with XRE-family HTH domain
MSGEIYEPSCLGTFVRSVRRLQCLTLRDVASRAGLSVSFLSDVERGRRTLSPKNAVRVAAVLRADVKQVRAMWMEDAWAAK